MFFNIVYAFDNTIAKQIHHHQNNYEKRAERDHNEKLSNGKVGKIRRRAFGVK